MFLFLISVVIDVSRRRAPNLRLAATSGPYCETVGHLPRAPVIRPLDLSPPLCQLSLVSKCQHPSGILSEVASRLVASPASHHF